MLFFILAIATLLQASVVTTETCKLIRIPEPATVPDNLRDWKTGYSDYLPVEWSEECTASSCDPKSPKGIKFNVKESDVDRRRARTCLKRPKYSISSDGYPLNPAGRTGFKGRGMLKHWGPNHLVKVALVRTSASDAQILLHKTENSTTTPENFVDSLDDSFYDQSTERKIFAHLRNTTGSAEKARKLIREAREKSKEALSGNVPSTLNTDHAWVEMHLRVIDCKRSKQYCDAVGDVLYEQNYKWTSLNDTNSAKMIGTKPHLIGEELTKSQLKEYGVFCRIKRRKITKIMREVALNVGVTVAAIGAFLGIVVMINPVVNIPVVLVLAYATLVGLGSFFAYRIHTLLRCR